MGNLSVKARIYIIGSVLFSLVLFGLNVVKFLPHEILPTLALAAVASMTLVLKVEGATVRSHYNISFLVYAFTLVVLGPEDCMIVILISNFVEWAWHKYPWYIQSFNIASYLVAVQVAVLASAAINPSGEIVSLLGVLSVAVAMAIFTLVNHLMVGIVIWLARGENFKHSGVFDRFPLMLDFTLLCMGGGLAYIWLFSPYGVMLGVLPLYLIYTTLRVPALERKTETDPKTGLFNAEYFQKNLVGEVERANSFNRPLTIVMADLDLLRNINNTYGHLAGDAVLIGVANILKESVREYDLVARFGGEEYAIMMPETTPEQAYPLIETIRTKIENTPFEFDTSVTPIRVTMSFGISGRLDSQVTPSEIVHNADSALYHAKLKGRNGTFIYSEEGFFVLFGQRQKSHVDASKIGG